MGSGNGRDRIKSACYSEAKETVILWLHPEKLDDCLEKQVMQSTIPVSRTRGIPKTT